jgi:uncharacterized protein YbbC (DUF1343 family)
MSHGRTSQSIILAALVTLGLPLSCAPSDGSGDPRRPDGPDEGAPVEVRPGIEVLLSDSVSLVTGKRVGLITNPTGIDRGHRTTIDLLYERPEIELVALFGPEHGIRGDADPGERVDDGVDDRTGVPVFSLYGETREPRPEMLDGLDVLIFDIQDIGARYYTYMSTMTVSMEAAAEAGVHFIVLDRPNPIGGAVQGNILDPEFASFVGRFPLPMRYGMTPGELARYYADAFELSLELHVVPVDGWRRGMSFEETGLPWVRPSPNMPDVESATHYPGTALFEGTDLSVGRGTDRAFQQIGAPWLDGEALAEAVRGYGLAGFSIEPVRFTPEGAADGKYNGREVSGIRLRVIDPDRYDPTRVAIALLVESRRLAGDEWEWRPGHFDRLAGTDRLREGIDAGLGIDALTEGWDAALAGFREARAPYLIYR